VGTEAGTEGGIPVPETPVPELPAEGFGLGKVKAFEPVADGEDGRDRAAKVGWVKDEFAVCWEARGVVELDAQAPTIPRAIAEKNTIFFIKNAFNPACVVTNVELVKFCGQV
jgi:hypothetical protein